MTVAIAALCKFANFPSIIAAEDHMITAGDVEFEQPQPKIWQQGQHAIAMLYGDSAAQAHIALQTEAEVLTNGIKEVSEIAVRYCDNLVAYVRKSAELSVLAPLQLTSNSFLLQQNSMNPELVLKLTQELQNHYWESSLRRHLGGAIIAGADAHGGHIFRVEYDVPTRLDRIGFVAAGSGQWHAESQFMFSRYTSQWEFPEALSLVYTAKKRAEVAPGVGNETDIVVIMTTPPSVLHFAYDSPLVLGLEERYEQAKKKHDEATEWHYKEVRGWVNAFVNPPSPSPPVPPTSAPPTPPAPTPAPAPAKPSDAQKSEDHK